MISSKISLNFYLAVLTLLKNFVPFPAIFGRHRMNLVYQFIVKQMINTLNRNFFHLKNNFMVINNGKAHQKEQTSSCRVKKYMAATAFRMSSISSNFYNKLKRENYIGKAKISYLFNLIFKLLFNAEIGKNFQYYATENFSIPSIMFQRTY